MKIMNPMRQLSPAPPPPPPACTSTLPQGLAAPNQNLQKAPGHVLRLQWGYPGAGGDARTGPRARAALLLLLRMRGGPEAPGDLPPRGVDGERGAHPPHAPRG